MSDPIKFVAAVGKVQTMVDGGIRVIFNLPETAIMQMAQLAECQRWQVPLEITAIPTELQKDDRRTATNKRERKHLKTKAADE